MNYSVATRLLLQPRPQGLLVFQYILFKSERVGYDDIHVACDQSHLCEFGKDFGAGATTSGIVCDFSLLDSSLPGKNCSRNCTSALFCCRRQIMTRQSSSYFKRRNSRSTNQRTRTLNEHDLCVWLLLSVIGKFCFLII